MGLLMLPFGSKLAWLIKGTVRDGGTPATIKIDMEKQLNSLKAETIASGRRAWERELRWSSERIEKLIKQEDQGFWVINPSSRGLLPERKTERQ